VSVGIELAQKTGEPWAVSGYHQMLAHNYQSIGNYEQSLKDAEEAWKNAVAADFRAYQIDALWLKCFTCVKMKSLAEAEKTAEELKQIVEEGMNSKWMRNYHYLTGLMKLEKEKFSEAILDFKKYLSLQSYGALCRNVRVIDSLALAYYRSGDMEKAKEEYERITSLTDGRLTAGDIYAKSFYKLGEIYEQQGNKSKAIENYEKFLDLWKEAAGWAEKQIGFE
jgi:tetratricopeptide (TPR) repeat protein